jgi:hypothetical protein
MIDKYMKVNLIFLSINFIIFIRLTVIVFINLSLMLILVNYFSIVNIFQTYTYTN